MKLSADVGLRFSVPRASRVALSDDVAHGTTGERTSMATMYLDTETCSLARAGIEWRLRREGRRWIQTLKIAGKDADEPLVQEVLRPRAQFDAVAHVGTSAGARLLDVLKHGSAAEKAVGVRFQTEIRRVARRIRVRGAVVDAIFDEGRLLSDQPVQRICDIEFRLVSGSETEMLRLVQRWQRRFQLLYDPRSTAERGERLAQGDAFPQVRKGTRPAYHRDVIALEAFCSVLDECLGQITRNAVGLTDGNAALRAEHVHQLRVGIRRLRSALRSFDAWVPAPPEGLVDQLRALFAKLGLARDADVLDSGVAAALKSVGAPPIVSPPPKETVDAAAAIRSEDTQRMFLEWFVWRLKLAHESAVGQDGKGTSPSPTGDTERPLSRADEARTFRRRVHTRLRRWHARIAAHWEAFDSLDEVALHDLRKRIKRQRYAVEFFASLMPRRRVDRYLTPLSTIQERMGELNDLFMARAHYQHVVAEDPAAWFALGWIAARIELIRFLAKPELERLVEVAPPRP